MKNTKGKGLERALALLLAVVMVAGMIPTSAFATAEETENKAAVAEVTTAVPAEETASMETASTENTSAENSSTEETSPGKKSRETNTYKVYGEQGENGTISIGNPEVTYDGECKVTVTPQEGYRLDDIKVNGVSWTGEFLDGGDEAVEIVIKGIQEDKQVEAVFVQSQKTALSKVTLDDGFIRKSGRTYVYAKEKQVSVATDCSGIKIYEEDAKGTEILAAKNVSTNADEVCGVLLGKTTKITKIRLRDKWDGKSFYSWRTVEDVTAENPIKIIVDQSKPQVSFTPDTSNRTAGGFYSANFKVEIQAEDATGIAGDEFSGLESVTYWITADGVTTQEETEVDLTKGDIRLTKEIMIPVTEEKNNSDHIRLHVKVKDQAGNEETYTSEDLKGNCTAPVLQSVTVDGSPAQDAMAGYYKTKRTATVVFEDRASAFDEEKALEAIGIEAENGNGQAIPLVKKTMVRWEHAGNTHTATICFQEDASYKWRIGNYTNKANLKLKKDATVENGEALYEFTVDTTAPEGKIKLLNKSWEELLSKLTFGLWTNKEVEATVEAEDATSPLCPVQYYKTAGSLHSLKELETAYQNEKFKEETIRINTDQKFVIYARIADYAGNTLYMGTDGAVFDNTESKITLTPEKANEHGFYNNEDGVEVQVQVTESQDDTDYSGIKSIDYEVIVDGEEENPTQKGNLYTFAKENPEYADLLKEWSGTVTVEPKDGKNNSDQVVLRVIVVDNAGNRDKKEKMLSINTSEIKATVEMDEATPNKVVEGRGYYSVEQRTATITVIERSSVFDKKAATEGITVEAKDAEGNAVENAYSISEWMTVNGTTPEEDRHTATVFFKENANYTWGFAYTNKAGNTLNLQDNKAVSVTGNTPFCFTVDDADPYGSISVGKNKWTVLLDKLTFGLFHMNTVDVKAEYGDDISPVTVEFYKTSDTNPLIINKLDELYKEGAFQSYEDFSVSQDERFVIYLRVADDAGNYIYISSDGNIVDKKQATILLTPEEPKKNAKYYSDNVTVNIKVEDPAPYSGIQTIQYWVEKDGDKENPTQKQTLYTFDSMQDGITYSDLQSSWEGTVTVDALLNNSCNVKLFVKVVDNAGNETVEPLNLDLDVIAPAVAISYDNNTDNNGNTYFNAQRRATVVMTERTHHFNKEKATESIVITAKDANGDLVEDAYTISDWTTVEGETPDEATHTATIFFEKDANYTLDISYTDEAGNKNSEVKAGDSRAPFRFTVDTTAPTGTITAESEEGRKVTWKKLRDTLTFGFWSKKKITLSAVAKDATSAPIGKVEYYKVQAENATDNTVPLTAEQLDRVSVWKDFKEFAINENQQFVVYLKITDLAGNYTYLSTNGLIVDHQAPMEEVIAPAVTIRPEQPVNGIYNRDVKVAVTVKDPMVGGTYSGMRQVAYEVRNMGEVTQKGTLYQFEMEEPKQADLQQSWSGEILVDSKKNNSNDVEIIVYGQDNALNDSEDSRKIKIDVTAPKIRISYDNNNADSDKYFKENRKATITVTERNFNAQDVITTIKNTDGSIPKVSSWKKGKGTGNGDNTTWTAMVSYNKDGDYTFGIQYTDLAGNRAKDIGFAEGTVAGKEFTIDKTVPTFTVSYDNNAAQNGNYYKASRTATIRVTEHNFDASRVVPEITATDNGKNVGTPSISSWKQKGDVYTASITYSADALYTFDISMKDKAGNAAKEYAEEKFYVDKTMPILTITGVKNHSANAGDVSPAVSFSDTNFDPGQSAITLTGANRGTVKLEGSYADGNNGRTFTFKNFAKEKAVDDIYTLTASTTDKAGNTVKQTVTFSVNRFGSTYEFGKHLKMINGAYVKEVKDIVLTEINPDALKNRKITLFKNNETMNLKEGEDYKIQASGGNGEWHRYKYTIFKENFAENGVYRITVSSEDAAGNVAENTLDTKNQEIGFGVDAEKPLLNITNLEEHQTYPVEELKVLMTAKDNLILSSLAVYMDGEEVPFAEWTAEEIAEILSDKGEFTFTIAGDSKEAHSVKVVAKDAAGNEEIAEVKDFYVTTDVFVRFLHNETLLYGSAAAIVLLAGLVFLLTKKKRKIHNF